MESNRDPMKVNVGLAHSHPDEVDPGNTDPPAEPRDVLALWPVDRVDGVR